MANLHELTKQLDVLTWNSRSVLNALIRSAMAAGSSKGFTVNRGGKTITLGRDGIFQVHQFYEMWESEGFGQTAFDVCREKCQQTFGQEFDKNLAIHAKIMWMNTDNVVNADNDEVWIDLIKALENPKWFTNTAPIPLNIRTPIYDENLSTKTYDDYETYLFPNAYYVLDTLGYAGDGNDHQAGGQNWLFDVDDRFKVTADRILLGTQDPKDVSLVGNMYKTGPLYCLEGGTNSFAFDKNSFSYGQLNMVNGQNSAILGGVMNGIVANNAAIIGGDSNFVAQGRSSAIGGGIFNNVVGDSGFAANGYNSVGGYSYTFQRYVVNPDGIETQCEPTYTDELTGCQYALMNKDSASGGDGDTALTAYQIYVTLNEVQKSGIDNANRISSNDRNMAEDVFDFKVGDRVVLYGFSVSGGSNGVTRIPCGNLVATVKGVIPRTRKIAPTRAIPSGEVVIGYIVELDKEVTSANISGLADKPIRSGRISRQISVSHAEVDSNGRLSTLSNANADYSDAFGYNTVAGGHAQTVVGQSNKELLSPKFIVGSGPSRYVRANSFVSGPNATYSLTSGFIVSGVSTVTTAYIHGEGDINTVRRYDDDYNNGGVEKYAGMFAYSIDPRSSIYNNENLNNRALLRVYHDRSCLAIGENGLMLYSPVTSWNQQWRTIWNELYCEKGCMAIHAGETVPDTSTTVANTNNNWASFHTRYVQNAEYANVPGGEQTITIWSHDILGMHGSEVRAHAAGYIRMYGGKLQMSIHDTSMALTAQPTDYGVESYLMDFRRDWWTSRHIDRINNTGMFYFNGEEYTGIDTHDVDFGSLLSNPYTNSYHVIASSKVMTPVNDIANIKYDVAELILPGKLSVDCDRTMRGSSSMPHPMMYSATIYGKHNSYTSRTLHDTVVNLTDEPGYIVEELAYLSDVKQLSPRVMRNVANLAYVDADTARRAGTDLTIKDTSSGINYTDVLLLDNFLNSLRTRNHPSYTSISATGTTVTASNVSSYMGKIIRPKSFAGAAGQMTNVNALSGGTGYSKALYLDGVQINPAFCMAIYNDEQFSEIAGMSYLAFGPIFVPGNDIGDVYVDTVQSDKVIQSLYSSKYSMGTSTFEYNLYSIWAITASSDTISSGIILKWRPLLKSVLVSVANGIISIEGQLNIKTLKDTSMMGAENDNGDISAVSQIKDWVVNKSSTTEPRTFLYRLLLPIVDLNEGLRMGAMTYQAPGGMFMASDLYGEAYTADTGTRIIVTGSYQKSVGIPGGKHSSTDLYNRYHEPVIVLEIKGTMSKAFFEGTEYVPIHITGPINTTVG